MIYLRLLKITLQFFFQTITCNLKLISFYNIFNIATENIILSKPKPINEESIATLNKYQPVKDLRVNDHTTSKFDSASYPKINKTAQSTDNRPRESIDSIITLSLDPKKHQTTASNFHRYPTRSKNSHSGQLSSDEASADDIQRPYYHLNAP